MQCPCQHTCWRLPKINQVFQGPWYPYKITCFVVCFGLLLWGFFLLFRWGFFNPFTCHNFIKFYQKQRFLKGFSEASPVPANLVRQNKKVHINPTYKNPRKDVWEKHPPTNLLHISCWKSKAQFELLCFHHLFWRATLKEKVSVPCLKACEEPAWRIVGSGSLLTLLLDKKRAWRCWWWQSREGILALYRKFLILLISMWHESQ